MGIAVNPTDPQDLIAAWNDYGPGDSCGLGYSTNGGRTWHTSKSIGHMQDHNMLTLDRYNDRALVAYSVWTGYRARSYALISSDSGLTYQGPYEIAADYMRNAVDRFDVSLAGAPDGTIYATSGIWQDVNEWNEQAVVASQMRPGETVVWPARPTMGARSRRRSI